MSEASVPLQDKGAGTSDLPEIASRTESDSHTTEAGEAPASAPGRRRRRRGGRGRGRGRGSPSGVSLDGGPSAEPEAQQLGGERLTPTEQPQEDRAEGASLQGQQPLAAGGRLHEGQPLDAEERPHERQPLDDASAAPRQEGEEPTTRRRRRRRGGRGRSRSTKATEAGQGDGDDRAAALDPAGIGTPGDAATDIAPLPATTSVSEKGGTKLEEEPSRDGASRERRRRAPWQRRRESAVRAKRVQNKTMLVTELGERHQIAVLEDRQLVEHYITRSGARSMVGSIFLGKVQNVLPGMEAAFIDIGRGRNAVLYAGELSYDEDIEGEAPRIEQVLKSGKNVMVQVTKDPIGGKGARLTQQVSLPGRYLVFVPNSDVFGISRRLSDRERARLKDALKALKPSGHGVIVRTAAEGASEEELQGDLARLTDIWAGIEKSAKRGRAPRLLYEEPELTVRVVRDLFTGGEFKELVTDSQEVYERVGGYLADVAPDLVGHVRMHEGPLPLLEAYHVLEQIHKALDRKVWLPSGGYIVIDRTEAMTVIDVNTGRHVGKASLEETVTKTNLEAAEEIARQLRLRDIGGIIIIDFIDMLLERNRDKLVQTLKNALAQDKTRSQVFEISALGVLEVTRKRISAGLLESFSQTCPTCEGRGILLTHNI